MAMHIYTIHEHPDTPAGERDPDPIAIREGFSVFALVFSLLWFLSKKMWRDSLLLTVVIFMLVAVLAAGGVADPMTNVVRVLMNVGLGLFAHDLYRAHLTRRGYRQATVASGGSKEEAILEYLMRPEEQQPAPETPVTPTAPGTLTEAPA